MKRQMLSGKIEEIIYARLEPGEDLLPALWDICKENDVKTGILLDATGSMNKVKVMRYPHESQGGLGGINYVEIPGPLEVSAHGIIGMGWVPDQSVRPPPVWTRGGATGFGAAGFEAHESPYFHVHITVSSASQTVCGHLMEGSPIDSLTHDGKADVPTHFTVAIAKASGIILRAVFDKKGYYHELVRA
ncbi:DNA-binding protein [Bradyrhizobium sp. 183]|uniref:PCC domain-containing protein n=1 Tax=unclassified Bradyrhizobium TaxID=2631580 RepID=UPI001FFF02EC|nr:MULTISPECIES: DUF296 domain-containing protein [unclassified Bradyrhizobium]UPJ79244.1 DNA-binding protein [Bradyrhizobium sp. 184]UPJ87037.1 DNA-binding protein [Bradyrhizobium sp. 183]